MKLRPVISYSRWAGIFAALLAWSAAAQAPNDVRVALVIGNSAYSGRAALVNPANDASAMSATLKTLGFTVFEVKDASHAQMRDAIAQVQAGLKGKQGIGMLYYAGHGLQVDFRNYMVPVDARLTSASDIFSQTVDVGSVVEAFKAAGNRMNIVVLDACRDNPFAAGASAKGLAPLDAPSGTFLAYATAPGNVAEDGDAAAGNGLYTGYLVKELQRPAVQIEDVFKRVRLQVRQKSQGRQLPWESTSLEEEFVFNDGRAAAAQGGAPAPAPAAGTPRKSAERPAEAALAEEKADWDRIAKSRNPDDFYEFLKKHPSGAISELADATLERLSASKITKVANKEGVLQVHASKRFQLGDRYRYSIKDGYTNAVQFASPHVTELNDDTVRVGQSLLTREGAVISNPFFKVTDPPRQDLPAGDYAVGKKWSYVSTQTNLDGRQVRASGEVKIVALEDVTVPAGTFKAYRLEHLAFHSNGTRSKLITWMRPEWGLAIKMIREIRHPSGGPTLDTREALELPAR